MVHCAFHCSWMFLVHFPHVLDPPEPQRVKASSKYCIIVKRVGFLLHCQAIQDLRFGTYCLHIAWPDFVFIFLSIA
jgi:hypothetical protein